MAEALVKVVASFENLITARNDGVRSKVEDAVGLLSVVLKGPAGLAVGAADLVLKSLDAWYEANNKEELDRMVADFYEDLQLKLGPQFGYNWTALQNSGAGLVVNIYGSEDWVTAGNVFAGYVDELGGYSVGDDFHPLFNIEIEGADHYDYIKGVRDYSDISDPTERQAAIVRNELISKFVAQLILNADDPDALRQHMVLLASQGLAQEVSPNYWQITAF